jgi:hypothetical protein
VTVSRSVRYRALVRAARAWDAGKPHQAWEILAGAGFTRDEWRVFQSEAVRRARSRYLVRMSAR